MNILVFIDYPLTYPIIDGATLRLVNIFKNLDKKGKLFLYFVKRSDSSLEVVEKYKKEGIFDDYFYINCGFFDRYVLPKLTGIIQASISTYSKIGRRFAYDVKDLIKKFDVDVLHIHMVSAGILASNLDFQRRLLDLTDCSSLQLKRADQVKKGLFTKTRIRIDLEIAQKIERYLLKKFSYITVASPIDKQCLKQLYPSADIRVIPNGVDEIFFSYNKKNDEYPSIIFFGNMNYPPNIDAATYLLDEIFPHIRNKISNVKLYIVGANPNREILEKANLKGVYVTGFVKDIRPYIAKATIAVIPLRFGSGIKNKILESMAMGKAVVTTPIGAEGLPEEVKRYLIIEESTAGLVNHTINLLEDEDRRRRLGYCGKQVVRKWYSWKVISKEFEKIYMELLNEK